jgi:hypothetical protein
MENRIGTSGIWTEYATIPGILQILDMPILYSADIWYTKPLNARCVSEDSTDCIVPYVIIHVIEISHYGIPGNYKQQRTAHGSRMQVRVSNYRY